MPLSDENIPEPMECKEALSVRRDDNQGLDGNTAIFFDWDDTILASSYLWGLGYRLDSVMNPTANEELHSQLKELEVAVLSVLKKAVTLGKVCIITNAETGWVQRSAEKFIPGVSQVLEGIEVFSARSTFESKYPDDPLQWKVSAFEECLKPYLERSKLNVISFGDSHVERQAVRTASRSLRESLTKSVKFAERPTIEQLRRQIELITNCFQYIQEHDGDLDLQLTVTQHHPTSKDNAKSSSDSTSDSASPSSSSSSSDSRESPCADEVPAIKAPSSTCAQEHLTTSTTADHSVSGGTPLVDALMDASS